MSVSLESRAKLPTKILEIVTDASTLLAVPINASQSADMLLTSAKQLTTLVPVIDNSAEILQSLNEMMDAVEEKLPQMDKGIDVVCGVNDTLQTLERQNYHCTVPKSTSADSFASSVASSSQTHHSQQ
ncbi:unnamed protein product [Caenorhabditis angaria]|uniref:BLOC-1-related complex subunit 7 n=1 Tax=Caenorhabditis angaria TaxID=860376 RepID=A0A9P1J379_9PELO|nr:unnamed protein product [Caenorhabditis angaria]